MAVYERQTNLPVVSNSQSPSLAGANLPSISLGTVLIQSLETMTEAIESDYDRDKMLILGIEKVVDRQFTKHLKNIKKGTGGSSGSNSKSEEAYWEQKKFIEWQNYLKRKEKEEKQERDREIAEKKKNTDELFSQISNISRNPLKGVSDTLDKGLKDAFTGINKLRGMSLGEITSNVAEKVDNLVSFAKKRDKLEDMKFGTFVGLSGLVMSSVPAIMGLVGRIEQEIPLLKEQIKIAGEVRIPETINVFGEKMKVVLGNALEDVKNNFAKMLEANPLTAGMGEALSKTSVSLGHKKVLTGGSRTQIDTMLEKHHLKSTGDDEKDLELLEWSIGDTGRSLVYNYEQQIKELKKDKKKTKDKTEKKEIENKITRLERKIRDTKISTNEELESLGNIDIVYERLNEADIASMESGIHGGYAAKEAEIVKQQLLQRAMSGELTEAQYNLMVSKLNFANKHYRGGIESGFGSSDDFLAEIRQIPGMEGYTYAKETRSEFQERRGKEYLGAMGNVALNIAADLWTGTPNTGSALTSGM